MYGNRQYARNYIKPILGDKVISRITSTDIQRMYTKLKRRAASMNIRNMDISSLTLCSPASMPCSTTL